MSSSPSTPPPRRRSTWPWLLVLLLAAIAALAYGGYRWQGHQAQDLAQAGVVQTRLETLGQRLDSLRGDQGVQAKRLQQAIATNRILRDELLGLSERAALIEDSLARYSDPARLGAHALRLDEAEVLLSLGQQRLQIAGDVDGARRSYALAAGVLEAIEDPAYLNLRQTLGQERAALDALDGEPRARALARLDAWAATIDAPQPASPPAPTSLEPWWKRAFIGIVQVQDLETPHALDAPQRADAQAGLQLEITLARAAAERRDTTAYRAALGRADAWLTRLGTPVGAANGARAQLREIAALPLSPRLPTLGTTLIQLRQLRANHREPLP
ncbi:uroporphyrinogen-III C-methyltransferase [Lysobacter ciconiae]|uniref:Uroporphyrinogen-III C-methyltransferase n=1 Tax=Novilysobacter ciconiae TaxID=2781022 RepID=A0A7S6UI10_9GAMM|nr:uroporphyrinogen-III C-methyltransferase [Lysobacter ciconiae]QOW20681.1 uroporphyrinogen-III C-methyltransferase [Lysobacter ciconiae]